jgi:zinc finger HIT domain-containing protein 1
VTAQTKFTPNVRKVMQSQKTFANHLDDYLALQALESNPSSNATKRPGGGKKDTAASTPRQGTHDNDVAMTDVDLPPVLPPANKQPPAPHTGDNDALLVSRVPEMPSDEELRRLLARPPLSYLEALGTCQDTYPRRSFCEVCGYWGRVRCMKCGTKVCALNCLETHREECVTRYGI